MILQQLGIYGWKEQDENLVMASSLTGDRSQRQHPVHVRHHAGGVTSPNPSSNAGSTRQ